MGDQMLDDAQLLAIWFDFNSAFNRDDLDACAAMVADDFNGMANDIYLATKEEFIAAARNGRSHGWTRQEMASVTVAGNIVTGRYFNVFADGSRTEGVGVILFDDEGKMTRVRTLNNSGTAMRPEPE
jgi:hypothetical protein